MCQHAGAYKSSVHGWAGKFCPGWGRESGMGAESSVMAPHCNGWGSLYNISYRPHTSMCQGDLGSKEHSIMKLTGDLGSITVSQSKSLLQGYMGRVKKYVCPINSFEQRILNLLDPVGNWMGKGDGNHHKMAAEGPNPFSTAGNILRSYRDVLGRHSLDVSLGSFTCCIWISDISLTWWRTWKDHLNFKLILAHKRTL